MISLAQASLTILSQSQIAAIKLFRGLMRACYTFQTRR